MRERIFCGSGGLNPRLKDSCLPKLKSRQQIGGAIELIDPIVGRFGKRLGISSSFMCDSLINTRVKGLNAEAI